MDRRRIYLCERCGAVAQPTRAEGPCVCTRCLDHGVEGTDGKGFRGWLARMRAALDKAVAVIFEGFDGPEPAGAT